MRSFLLISDSELPRLRCAASGFALLPIPCSRLRQLRFQAPVCKDLSGFATKCSEVCRAALGWDL